VLDASRLKPDPFRAHDPEFLHFLKLMGYKCLITDFGPPGVGTSLRSSTLGPPGERLMFEDARDIYQQFWSGRMSLLQLLAQKGNTVLLAPEKMDLTPLLVYKLQRDLLELFQGILADPDNYQHRDFSFGLLVYVPRFPVHNQVPLLRLGLMMTPNVFLDIGLWPFIREVVVFRPSHLVQYSESWTHPIPEEAQWYHALIVFSGDNDRALEMVRNANAGTWLDNQENTYQIGWGCLRQNVDYLEFKSLHDNRPPKRHGDPPPPNYCKPLLFTWRWLHVPFPACKALGDDRVTLEVRNHRKWVFDLDTGKFWKADCDKAIRLAVQKVRESGWKVQAGAPRRSVAHHGREDSLTSWDITVEAEDVQDVTNCAHAVWEELASLEPLAGTMEMFNFEHKPDQVILECTNSQVLRDLMNKKVVCWVLMVYRGMAVVTTYGNLRTLADLQKLKSQVLAHNAQFDQGSQKVRAGARYVERIVLPQAILEDATVRETMKDSPDRVFWDRQEGKHRGPRDIHSDRRSTSIQEPTEVLVTLGDWYKGKMADIVREVALDISPGLLGLMKAGGVVTEEEALDVQGTLRWRHTNREGLLKLECKTPEMARYLCATVVKQSVKFPDSLGTMTFQSPIHPQHTADLERRFRSLSITDIPPEDVQGMLRGQEGTGVSAGTGGPAATALPTNQPTGLTGGPATSGAPTAGPSASSTGSWQGV